MLLIFGENIRILKNTLSDEQRNSDNTNRPTAYLCQYIRWRSNVSIVLRLAHEPDNV